MTLGEAISQVDTLKVNTYSLSEKIRWISTVEGIIKNNVIDTHEGGEGIEFNGYTGDTPLTTMLIAPAPYDELYLRYLEMQIDYANGDLTKYNNALAAYQSAYEDFAKYYNRTHLPKQTKLKFF